MLKLSIKRSNTMEKSLVAFYITFPNKDTAENICNLLIREKLIACSNTVDIQAAYWWQDTIQQEGEILVFAKSCAHLVEAINHRIEALHPYEVPCIIHWPIQANPAYTNWVISTVQ